MNLMNAVGKISDEHIAEFAHVTPKKFYIAPWARIAAAAACLVLIITAVPIAKWLISSNANLTAGSYCSDVEELLERLGDDAPFVIFNDTKYGLTSDAGLYEKLPKGYEFVGEVTNLRSKETVQIIADDDDGGFSYEFDEEGNDIFAKWFCVGDRIYQNPKNPDSAYIYTPIMSGDKSYKYIRLQMMGSVGNYDPGENIRFSTLPKSHIDAYFMTIGGLPSGVKMNDIYYVVSVNQYHPDRLPEGCELIGEVLGYQNPGCYDPEPYHNGNSNYFDIGDTVYQNPENTDELYVYSAAHNDEAVRYVRCVLTEIARYENYIDSMCEEWSKCMNSPRPFTTAYVIFNGRKYTFRGVHSKELLGNYKKYNVVGEILSDDPADRDKEGFSSYCNVGDLIYQDPEDENIIYVLFTGVYETSNPFYMWFNIDTD